MTGWCSWYAFGTHINEKHILDHTRLIARTGLPLDVILIDDGWQSHWGDWTSPDPNKFPRGMKRVAATIAAHKRIPGIWIAPFLVHPEARIAMQHPEWLVASHTGTFVEGGKITALDHFTPWRRWILDLSLQGVQTYLKKCFKTIIEDWRFRYIKLDFLYAQHFHPAYPDNSRPDVLLHEFLLSIKKRYPDVYLSASGCPLEPAMGAVDAMRISDDIVNPQLRNLWPINRIVHSARLRQLKDNLAVRGQTHRFWHIDPDVFVTHPSYGFTPAQVRELRALIIQANGLRFLGDNLLELDQETIQRVIMPLY